VSGPATGGAGAGGDAGAGGGAGAGGDAGGGGLPTASGAGLRRWLRRAGRHHRSLVAGVLLLQGAATAAGLVFPHELGAMVAGVSGPHGSAAVRRAGAILLAALVVQALLSRVASRRAAILGETVLAELREGFIEGVLDLPLGVVERAGTGELLNRASSDVEQLSYSVHYAVAQMLIAAVQTLLTAAALILTAPILGLVLLPAAAVLVASARWYQRRAPAGYRATQAAWDHLNARTQETIAAGRTVEALGLGPARTALVDADAREWITTERYTLRLRTVFLPLCESVYVLPLVLAVALGGLLHAGGHLPLAAVAAGALYAQQLVVPVNTLLSELDELQLGTASLARLLGVQEVPRRAPTSAEPHGDEVRAEGVHFAYRADREVLHGLDLAPARGSTLALVGPSGAGKSTLALLLTGVHAPTAGRVTVGGVDVHRLPAARLRQEVVLVTQEHHVFAGTLRDNLALADPSAGDDRLLDALAAVDAADIATRLPAGLDTEIGSGSVRLSPGDAQRVALARLVLADPHTLVLDEATALLDPGSARHLEQSLRRVLAGRTVVAVAHRLQAARDADEVAVVDGGRIVERGSHDELLAAGGAYAALWRSWSSEE
jgi:ABC-type multidrug transport system fused ATPase/permease subunit